jgi:DNA repair protein RecO (recombination protein O)
MLTRRVRALSLKKTKLGESDLIVTLLAEDGCQIRAVAKGSRKPGSRFGARVEPFSVVDLLLHGGRTLDIITDAETAVSHAPLRADYDRSQAGSVVVDFLDKVSVECQAEDRLFGLACATLDAMEAAGTGELLCLVDAFLLKGMAMHGYRPQFDACVGCGAPASGSERFALESGGPVCDGCDCGEVTHLAAPVRAALVAMMRARMADVADLGIPGAVAADTLAFLRAYVVYHVPARLKALALYEAEARRDAR